MEPTIALVPRFRRLRPLGRGARGEVLAVWDSAVNSEVALKLLHAPSPELRKRFPSLVEATANATGLVRLGEWIADAAQGHDGLTMAVARGAPLLRALRGDEDEPASRLVLGQRVEHKPLVAPSDPLLARTRRAFRGVAIALAGLHAAGFVHGDLRPENVLVDENERVTVLDVDGARPPGTVDDGLVATTWAAPELGVDPTSFSPACDVYALGTLLFAALTGDVPFPGSAHDVVLRKGTVRAPSPSFLVRGVPADLDALCDAMLERVPERRASLAKVMATLAS
jgi:serine/threonine protein kinase